MTTWYIRTNDPAQCVRIPSNQSDGPITVVLVHIPDHRFNLQSTLKSSALTEARSVAREAGLRLREPRVVAAAQ